MGLNGPNVLNALNVPNLIDKVNAANAYKWKAVNGAKCIL